MQVKIYKPNSKHLKLRDIVVEMFSDLHRSKDLAWRLTVRDFKGQYRQSYLGFLWVFVSPLMTAFVWIFLNYFGAVKLADTSIPYPVYVFTGTMLWAVLLESINTPLQQTSNAKGIMGKVNFPKEAILISGLYNIIFNSLIKLIILIIVLLIMGIMPTFQFLFVPIAFAGIILFGFTLGLITTPISMLYTDISRAIPLLMQFIMYLSPVVYTVPGTGILSKLVKWNPISSLITTGRSSLTGLPFEDLSYFFIITLIMLVISFFAWFFYRFSIPILVEKSGD